MGSEGDRAEGQAPTVPPPQLCGDVLSQRDFLFVSGNRLLVAHNPGESHLARRSGLRFNNHLGFEISIWNRLSFVWREWHNVFGGWGNGISYMILPVGFRRGIWSPRLRGCWRQFDRRFEFCLGLWRLWFLEFVSVGRGEHVTRRRAVGWWDS